VAADFEEPDSIQIDPGTGKYIGRVKWFNAVKGFGFIARGSGEELFFHKTSVLCNPDDLTDGAWILYDVEQGQKGLEASEIEVYEDDL
jgi:CspA family cold shock protein